MSKTIGCRLACALIATSLCFAQSSEAKDARKKKSADQPGITRAQADEILKELQQIRALLEKQLILAQGTGPAGPSAPVAAKLAIPAADPMLGSKDAPLTIVEFTDFQCAYCQRFHLDTFPDLKKKYVDTGIARFYSRDLPLDFHQSAFAAALAARCAGEQDQFWTLRNLMIANANRLSPETISQQAQTLKLDMKAFASCLSSQKYDLQVKAQSAEAEMLGVDGTPTFIVGKSTPEGVDGTLLVGAQSIAEFDAIVKKLLEK